jgi:Flp pilus assembly protein TadB
VIVALAIGISACIALPVAGAAAVIWWVRSFRQGRRLDRSGGGR